MLIRPLLSAGLLATAAGSTAALAEDPPYTLTANVNLVSDYYFRGLTQTWHNPAIQGGFDFAHNSGFYLGTWASNVSSKQYAEGTLEWDFYGGYNHKFGEDLSVGGGAIYYYYPDARLAGENYDTAKLFVNAGWKWLFGRIYYAVTDYFGANATTGYQGDTDGTMYFDLSANIPLPVWEGLTLVGHVGYTMYKEDLVTPINGESDPSYLDWKLGVTKTWNGGWNVGVFYAEADNDELYDNVAAVQGSGSEDLNAPTVILQVGRTF
jgi:uncharacterized protein (TIGR02001 family)